MTHDEIIQKAIEHLKENKVTKEMLDSPRVRERTVAFVWFKISGHSNCRLMLDSQTGELLGRQFSSDPFLEEYMSHCLLPLEAHRLASEIHEGHWDRFPELGTYPAPIHVELIRELERRCPGWSGADYEKALSDSLSRYNNAQAA
jgi:hypothetical protein